MIGCRPGRMCETSCGGEEGAVDVEGEYAGAQADVECGAVVGAVQGVGVGLLGEQGVYGAAEADGVDVLAGGGVPEADGAVVAAGDEQGVAVGCGGDGQGADLVGVAGQGLAVWCAGEGVPDADGGVGAGGGEPGVCAGQRGECPDPAGVSGEWGACGCAGVEVPEADGGVVAGRGEQGGLVLWGEHAKRADGCCVAGQAPGWGRVGGEGVDGDGAAGS